MYVLSTLGCVKKFLSPSCFYHSIVHSIPSRSIQIILGLIVYSSQTNCFNFCHWNIFLMADVLLITLNISCLRTTKQCSALIILVLPAWSCRHEIISRLTVEYSVTDPIQSADGTLRFKKTSYRISPVFVFGCASH